MIVRVSHSGNVFSQIGRIHRRVIVAEDSVGIGDLVFHCQLKTFTKCKHTLKSFKSSSFIANKVPLGTRSLLCWKRHCGACRITVRCQFSSLRYCLNLQQVERQICKYQLKHGWHIFIFEMNIWICRCKGRCRTTTSWFDSGTSLRSQKRSWIWSLGTPVRKWWL